MATTGISVKILFLMIIWSKCHFFKLPSGRVQYPVSSPVYPLSRVLLICSCDGLFIGHFLHRFPREGLHYTHHSNTKDWYEVSECFCVID